MTVYTNALLEDYFIDEDSVSDFTGTDTSETVIIADDVDVELSEPGPASFFGYPILTLLHTEDLLAVHLRKLLSDIDADNRLN